MIFENGQHIKCILTNSSIVEGTVIEYNNDYLKLRSLDDKDLFIINNPKQNIIITKISLNKDAKSELINEKKELEKRFKETYNKPSDDNLRANNLAKLKIMLIEQEKKIISEAVKNHNIGEVSQTKYICPNFFKKE